MHVLSLVNQKGGCGKTTTAVNLSGALARAGERVLLVDLDPQAHATMSVGCAIDEGEPSIADVLLGKVPITAAVREVPGGFDALPATEQLAEIEEVVARMVRPEHLFAKALAKVSTEYDYVLLDCPPRADGVLTANALVASNTALLVVEAGAFSLQGALKALRIFERMSRELDRNFYVRVVGTMFDRRTRLGRELLIGMQSQFGDILFDTVIHNSQRLREAAAYGVPVQVLDPRSRAATDFDEVAREVVAHARAIMTLAPQRTQPTSGAISTGSTTAKAVSTETESRTVS
jgi:chromosome partitioning protein